MNIIIKNIKLLIVIAVYTYRDLKCKLLRIVNVIIYI